ncbi:hypothetical protein FG386_003205 [Cryptosporidium ryanae]|uniref:uncharacterized protein n=1 Tax=Cryptosporidium ryanae TaxID=515981 RepID=UPI00351A4B8B|nr:hypothetical protein FG386_003205 [Cryptosporidium ryanae]
MKFKNRVNRHVSDYFRRNLHTSQNISDSNVSFPYKHEFFTGVNKLPILSSEPELINIPISPAIIQGYNFTSFEDTNNININLFPTSNIGFSMNSIEKETEVSSPRELDFKDGTESHIKMEDLVLIDEEIIESYNIFVFNENQSSEMSEELRKMSCFKDDGVAAKDEAVLLHPSKPDVKAISILDVVPIELDQNSTFHVILDSEEMFDSSLLELHDGWKHPTTRFSYYIEEKGIFKYENDYYSNIYKEKLQSHIINIPRSFIDKTEGENEEGEANCAFVFVTRGPKMMLSKVNSTKVKSAIRILNN